MILRSPSRLFPVSLVLLLFGNIWSASLTAAKKDQPSIRRHIFEVPPDPDIPPLYFEDSDSVLILDADGTVLRSHDLGGDDFKFEPVKGIPENAAWNIYLHPFEHQTAYAWGKDGQKHWITEDRGESWRSFRLDFEAIPIPFQPPFSYHAGDPNKVILNLCTAQFGCNPAAYYTTDGFRTPPKRMRDNTRNCMFAKSTELFQTTEEDRDDNRVICIARGEFLLNPFKKVADHLAVSDNFFEKGKEWEPRLDGEEVVRGIVNIAGVKGFIVAAAGSPLTSELGLYVSDDAEIWHRAVFPKDHKLEQDAYTILESTNYSIQVDVMTTMRENAMGVLFTSNSNGTYFTRNIEHTNRDFRGYVDFEKVTGIQGIVLVNVVDNWDDIEKYPLAPKKLKSKISFDDGRTFSDITADGDEIHLHSVSDISNPGKVFSSPAPGLIMGIGNKGKYLKPYDQGDLYVSDDAGMTWRLGIKEAHKYEFGDRGSVLLAIYDEGPTDTMSYSLDHGKKWQETKLEDRIKARILTTTPDSTSLKFLLIAKVSGDPDLDFCAYSINFEDLHEDKCGKSDFENWYARVDDKGESICVMGRKQWYRRRKADADCFVDKEFEDPIPQFEPCTCSKDDFECDYDFVPSDKGDTCVPARGSDIDIPDGQCKNEDDLFVGSSGFRLIPGNGCDRDAKGAVDLEKEVDRPCKDSIKAPASGEITSEITSFRAKIFDQYYYLPGSELSQDDNETVVMRTDEREVYITYDGGKTWEQIFEKEEIVEIYRHQYFQEIAYFLTSSKKVFYTINRGQSFSSFEAPAPPTSNRHRPVLGFHPKYKDWLIWTGAVDCGSSRGDCHDVAFFSENRGASWPHEMRFVGKCEFIKEEGGGGVDNLVYCEQYKDELLSNPLQLVYSDNWFADFHQAFDDIVDFATMSEFIVVAARKRDNRDALTCHTSVDGKTFADAQFPPSFEVPVQKAYTVLDSSTHAVFLHVTVNDREGSAYGSIIKSNSNGTSYVMSLEGVNRNERGFADFEKMLGLEGVIMVNVVGNRQDADDGKRKKLKTMITHNDGAQWSYMRAPEKDSEDKPIGCDVSDINACSLHLHSYTERRDPRATFSSPSAIGLMLGVGNVGEYLGRMEEADTYITRDGGVEWHQVTKGNYMWEYGDQGSILVIVANNVPTKVVFYSLDEGENWKKYQFADTDFKVESISTVPSDMSRNFILWGKSTAEGAKVSTVNLDFSELTDKQCKLNEDDPTADDYELWSPKHPLQEDNCLLGHVAQYHRKKTDRLCYNGRPIQHKHSIAKNCSCVRADFEWYAIAHPLLLI